MSLDPNVTIRRKNFKSLTKTNNMADGDTNPLQDPSGEPSSKPKKTKTLEDVYYLILSVKTDLSSEIKSVNENFEAQSKQVKTCLEENKGTKSCMDEMDAIMAAMLNRLEMCKSTVVLQIGQLAGVKRELENLKSEKRRHNLIIHGFKENANQSQRE